MNILTRIKHTLDVPRAPRWNKNKLTVKLKSANYLVLAAASTCLLSTQAVNAGIRVGNSSVERWEARLKAGHFLSQATMGGTTGEINALASRMEAIGERAAIGEWLNVQLAIPHKSFLDHFYDTIEGDGFTAETPFSEPNLTRGVDKYLGVVWWDRAVRAPDQLRQRVAWALMQIMPVTDEIGGGVKRGQLAASYYDVLQRNTFKSYKTLLKEVAYHPAMGHYLSHLHNAKADPALGTFADENFAREILQLFSVGIYQLDQYGNYILDSNGIPKENYTNDTIKNFAEIFTGLTYTDANGNVPSSFYTGTVSLDTMIMHPDYHDTTSKTLLRGVVIPAGQSGDEDVDDALDNIMGDPSVGPFVVRRLIQRLTSSNPSEAYIKRVTRFWDSSNGNLRNVIFWILMDSEARNSFKITRTASGSNATMLNATTADPLNGKIKEPVLMVSQIYRYFDARSQEHDNAIKPSVIYSDITNQRVFGSPSIFNHYSAEYAPNVGPMADAAPGLVLPESELLPRSFIAMYEGMHTVIRNEEIKQDQYRGIEPSLLNRLTWLKDQAANRSNSWLINQLDAYLLHGTMPDAMKQQIVADLSPYSNQEERISHLISIVLSSADFAVVN